MCNNMSDSTVTHTLHEILNKAQNLYNNSHQTFLILVAVQHSSRNSSIKGSSSSGGSDENKRERMLVVAAIAVKKQEMKEIMRLEHHLQFNRSL